jgi:glutaminase
MLKAVKTGRRDANLALLNYLAETGQIRHPETAIDSYERLCCLSGRLQDLARIGELLALKGPVAGAHRQAVNALMLTCGLYEASPDYAMKVGLPMKSGISGALLTTLPKRGVIVTYGPALNAQGNSVAGLAFVARMAQALNLSLFA